MPTNFDNLSDGSELTGDELPAFSSESEERVKRTLSKKRKTIQDDDDQVEEEEEELEQDDNDDDDDDEFKDELEEEEEALPFNTRRGKVASMPNKPSPLKVMLRRSPTAAKKAKSKLAATTKSKDVAKVKWKARTQEEDEEEDLVPSASASAPATPSVEGEGDLLSGTDDGQEDELELLTSSSPAVTKTARQLAKENKDAESTLLELPMTDESKKRKLTEAELALRRSETARKRRNQSEKKLEDDKIETINRLLKKQVGRSRTKLPRAGSVSDNEEDAVQKKRGAEILTRAALKQRPAPFFRYVSGVDGPVLGVPTGPPLVAEVLPLTVNRALIQEVDLPPDVKAEKEEDALETEWGPEGLYEYRIRTQFALSRKQWIGERKKEVTPPPEPELKQEHEEEQDQDAEEEEDDEDQVEAEPEDEEEEEE